MANTRKRKQYKDNSPFPAPTPTPKAQATSRVRTRAKQVLKKEDDEVATATHQLGSPFVDAPQRKQGRAEHGFGSAPSLNDPYMNHHTAYPQKTGTAGSEAGVESLHGSPSVFPPSNNYKLYDQPTQRSGSVRQYGQQQSTSFARPPHIQSMSWKSPDSFDMTASHAPKPKPFLSQAIDFAPASTGGDSEVIAGGKVLGGPTSGSTNQGQGLQQHTLRAEVTGSVSRYISGYQGQSLQQTHTRAGQAEVLGNPMLAPQPCQDMQQQLLPRQNVAVVPPEEISGAQAMQDWMAARYPPPSRPPQRRSPMDISRRRIPNSEGARQFLNHASWRPISKSHGVPRTEEDRLPYVKKIYDALVDTDNVWDISEWPQDARRFDAVEGVWGRDPRCIEAISHRIVDVCVKIHDHGVTGLDIALFPAMQKKQEQDVCFQFAQRIHFMALMLRHFKCKANQVMMSVFQMQYLSRIWSELRDLKEFWGWWMSGTEAWRNEQMNVAPFEDVPAINMTREEEKQAVMEAHQLKMQLQKQKLQHQQEQHQRQMDMQMRDGSNRSIASVKNPAVAPAEKRHATEGPSGHPVSIQSSLLGPPSAQQQSDTIGEAKPTESMRTGELNIAGSEGPEGGNDDPDWEALFGDGTEDAQIREQDLVQQHSQGQVPEEEQAVGMAEQQEY